MTVDADIVLPLIKKDLGNSWSFTNHIHNHPFFVPHGETYGARLVPSPADLRFFNLHIKELGLKTATITNGFDSIDLSPADVSVLSSKEIKRIFLIG